MNETKVVNYHKESCDVLITRPSKWGNPFKIGEHGDRLQVIKKYEDWIRTQPELLKSLHELEGKILGCCCKPQPCHGDILVKLLKEIKS